MKLGFDLRLITIFFIVCILLVPKSFGQTSQLSKISAGVTPDNFLYGLDVTLDHISLLLTFDNTAKAKKALEIAQERLLEVKQMTLENKLDSAQIAEREHVNTIETVKSTIKSIQNSNKTEELKEKIEVEREFEEHESEVQKTIGEVKIKIEIKGNITVDQQALIDSILKTLENKTGEVKIEIENEKGKTKIEIKQQIGKSDKEVNDIENEFEDEEGVTEIQKEKANEVILDAKQNLEELKNDLSKVNVTDVRNSVSTLLNEAESHLSRAITAYNQTDYGEAYGQAKSADRLIENAEKQLEKTLGKEKVEEQKLEIEVEVEKGKANVKVEKSGEKFKFTLDTTNKEKIISEIVDKIGLSRANVEKVLKIKVKEQDKSLEQEIHEIEKEEEG